MAAGPDPDLIVVGYDGSFDAEAALAWAIREATARSMRLRVVYCEHEVPELDGATATLFWSQQSMADTARAGQAVTEDGVQRAAAAGLAAEAVVEYGSTAAILVEHSKQAGLIVIGSRGLGALSTALLGSTGSHLASHAHCPVIVVRAEQGAGPVVVGVDGSPESLETLEWAFEFAERHELALRVLYAYEIPVYPEVVPYVPPVEVIGEVAAKASSALAEEVAAKSAKHPTVAVTSEAIQDRASWALVAASREASLVVVGSHGRGGFRGMLLGSTSQALLHHAHCTVAVIRHRQAGHRGRHVDQAS